MAGGKDTNTDYMKRIITTIILLVPFIAMAQTAPPIFQGSKYYEFRNAVRVDSAFFIPRKDTLFFDNTLKAPGMLTWRPQDSTIYVYRGNRWLSLVSSSGTGLSLDSARRSNDTLFFRYTTGGELAVAMNSIQNQYNAEQDANAWFNKLRIDSLGIGKHPRYKFDLIDGASIMRFDGKRLELAYDTVANQSVIIGYQAAPIPANLYRGTAIGTQNLFGATGLNLTGVGHSGGFGSVGNDNTFIGAAAALRMRGSQNTAVGNQALYSSDSSESTAVGDRAALGAYVIRSTFIGSKSTISANDYVGSIASSELGSTSGTLTSKGANTAALISAGGLSIGQIRAIRIDFSKPYPAANTDSFRSVICKIQVAGSDSLVYLSQGAFTYTGSGGIAKLSKVLSNVSVLGANGAADKSNQVVLGDTLNQQVKTGVIRIKTNQVPDTSQVLAWNGTEFVPSDHVISLKDFGAVGDGVTNDSAALARAAAYFNLRGGGTLYVPKGTYYISKIVDGTIARFRFLNGFKLEATGALFTNDNYKDSEWNATTFTSSGLTATAVTATPHGYLQDSTILVKNATDSNYNGSFTVSSVIDPYTFTYPIWQSTPNAATGISHDNGYRRILFEFDSCQNVVLNGLRYKGTVQPINNQYRLGWVALKLQQHSSNITVNDMNVEGASYGIWSGFYNVDEGGFSKGKIYMTAKNVGYPVALWKSGDESYFNLRSENVHRGVYIGSTNNSKFDIYTKNYDIAGALITSQPLNSTTLAGCRNLIVNVYDDSSRAKPTFYPFIGPRTIAVISGYNVVGATCQFKNINIHIESTGSNYVQGPLLNTTTPLTSLDGITVSGYMNRALSDPAQIYSELTIGNESALIAGAFSNVKVQEYKVINSTVGGTVRPAVISVKTLADNIQLNNYSSTAAMTVSLPTGRYIEYNNTTAGTTNQRVTESETTKDVVVSTTSVLGVTTTNKFDSAGLHISYPAGTPMYDFPNSTGRPFFNGLKNVAAGDSMLTTDAAGNTKMFEPDHLDNFVKPVGDSGVSTSAVPRSNNSGFGAFTSTAGATGYPATTGAGAGGGIVYQRSTLNSNNGIGSWQMWGENTPSDNLLYFRKRVSTSTWSSWYKIYHEGYAPVAVTSIALSLPSIFTVSGSPVTTTGTLTGTLATQSANTIFAGPTSSTAVPTFRSLVAGDIPALPFSGITGTVPVAQGGTGLTALGTSLQQLRVNAGATAYEFFTPSTVTQTSGPVKDFYTNATGADSLYAYTVAPSFLANNGDKVSFTYAGFFAPAGATARIVGVAVNGTNMAGLSNGVTLGGKWKIQGTIIRVSNTVIRYVADISFDNSGVGANLTLMSNDEITGQNLSANGARIALTVGSPNTNVTAILGSITYISAAP